MQEHLITLVTIKKSPPEEPYYLMPSTATLEYQDSASAFFNFKNADKVCRYFLNQPEHHKKISFAEEYGTFIRNYQGTLKWVV